MYFRGTISTSEERSFSMIKSSRLRVSRRWGTEKRSCDFDFCNDYDGVWRNWEIRGGDQSPVGEINLTHKLPKERARGGGEGGMRAETVGPRGVVLSLTGDVEAVRKRERNERRPRCSPYQDLFASPPSEERMGRRMRDGGEERRVHGGAYLRVIPEGRTPSAWDPADNVPPLRAIPPVYTGCRSCRIDCTLRRDVFPVRMLKSRG